MKLIIQRIKVKTKAVFLRLTQEIAWKELMDLSSDIREEVKRVKNQP